MDSLRFLLRDRNSKYTRSLDAVFETDNAQILLSPPRAPRANAISEAVVGTLRREALDHMQIYNEAHAQEVLTDCIQHYNRHRLPPIPGAAAPGQRRTAQRGHHHRPPGAPDPATAHPRRPDQRVPARRLTGPHHHSSPHQFEFSSGIGRDPLSPQPRRDGGRPPSGHVRRRRTGHDEPYEPKARPVGAARADLAAVAAALTGAAVTTGCGRPDRSRPAMSFGGEIVGEPSRPGRSRRARRGRGSSSDGACMVR
ncbi:integrase core domain-containing protein [Streptomyces sp. NPDC055134]